MPNNFKLTGDYYVSKAGNDSNDGLTPETPKLTVQAGLNLMTTTGKTLVIGSGVYNEQISKFFGVATNTIIGDGKVVLQGNGSNYFSIGASGAGGTINCSFYNVEIRDYFALECTGVFSITGFLYFYNCIIKNNQKILFSTANANQPDSSLWNLQIINSFIINSVFSCGLGLTGNVGGSIATVYGDIKINKSILINVSFEKVGFKTNTSSWELMSSYIDPNTTIKLPSGTPATSVNYNNIQGKIVMNSNGSVSGVNSNGVALSFAQHRIDYPTYNVNSFSSDPKFNNPRLLDFTLQAGSPNVSASSDYVTNIGGTEYAVPFTASSAAFTTNATSQSLEYRGIYYAISGSATTGSITSGPMFLQWPRTKPLTSVNWIGALEFNKTITASLAGNNNVPAYTTFTSASGAQGANPDRLKIAMRFSTQQTQPSTDAEWDNGGYWTAGTYQLFEPNTKPKVDYKGTGNGDPTYVETSAIGDLVPSWIQTQIILRNDYNR